MHTRKNPLTKLEFETFLDHFQLHEIVDCKEHLAYRATCLKGPLRGRQVILNVVGDDDSDFNIQSVKR